MISGSLLSLLNSSLTWFDRLFCPLMKLLPGSTSTCAHARAA
jgi:hypothetical protein